jgi:hypothetical protein
MFSPSFRLHKWYLDGIAETGETFIGYWAELAWQSFGLPYASCLEFDGRHAPVTQTHVLRENPPQYTEAGVTWASNGLACAGNWQPLAAEIPPLTLYADETGVVIWRCLHPLAQARIQSAMLHFTGLGYVEQLELTILPWRLPMRELHWGRFLSSDAYVVWIEWRGDHPLTIVYLNGISVGNVMVTTSALAWEGGGLELDDTVVLRDGLLIKTALARVPGLRALFPKTILHTRECKWRSRGTLSSHGTVHTGWAIHEIVQFQNNELA